MAKHDKFCPMANVNPYDIYCCSTCNPDEVAPWDAVCMCKELSMARAEEREKVTAK